MFDNEITIFAQTNYRNQNRRFGIKIDDRRRHMYLIGKTGMGKSTVQENMIVEDIRAGRGVAVVDPHGDLVEKIVKYIPNNRVNDVIYFNPSDMEFPISFNVVEQVEPHLRHLVGSGLIGIFQKLWADSWGPRLEYILRNAILAILDYPGATLLAVTRMLSDKAFRKKVVEKIKDPVVKAFWVNEFSGYADKFASEAVSPIQNKVGQFLSSSLIRNIVGQVKSSIDLRKVMDDNKILLMNLSKGRIGEDNANLLGSMMITKIQLAAMSRVDVPEKERKDFYLYVDEFQNFATTSFRNILSEARKYHLNLILAHQYILQLPEEVAAAVFGNIGTLAVFRVGAADAEELVKEFTPTFTEEDLVNLPKYHFYLKLMIDGISSEPFSAAGLPPLTDEEMTGNVEKVIKVSREKYAKDREVVEDKITRWHLNSDEPEKQEKIRKFEQPKIFENKSVNRTQNKNYAESKYTQGYKSEKNALPSGVISESKIAQKENNFNNYNIFKHKAICFECKNETSVSFQPDGIRPVFCKDCLKKSRDSKKTSQQKRLQAKEDELKKIQEDEIPLRLAMEKTPIFFKRKDRPDAQKNNSNNTNNFSKTPSARADIPNLDPVGKVSNMPNSGTPLSEDEEIKINS